MPLTSVTVPKFKPLPPVVITWNSFKKGLNTLLRENEIAGNEMTQATNLLLIGFGVPTKRWGSQNSFTAGATGYGRLLLPIKDKNGSQEVLAMTDWGIMTKKSGTSYTPITGASWASGYNLDAAELGNEVYIVSENREWVKYNFATLISFPSLISPTGLSVSNISGASGTTQWSWRVSATSISGGETIASTAISLASLPTDLSKTTVRMSWAPVSAASGDLLGYNVYRGAPGQEIWVGGTDKNTTSFDDAGYPVSESFRTAPLVNTTGGPKAKYIIRFQDRLILAGIPGEPTKVLISGRYPNNFRFDGFVGGSWVLIEPDSGEEITGLASYYGAGNNGAQQTIIVFKESSVWELKLSNITFGQYDVLVPTYRLLTGSQGCSSHHSIQAVENDIMFSNRKGIYILRYEPQLTNVINANEISAKIRPFFESLTDYDLTHSSASYMDKKYVLSFPDSKQSIVFDRERLSFVGPWKNPFGIHRWAKYVDSNGMDRWLAIDSSDNIVTEFSKLFTTDKGESINTIFKSQRADMGDWTLKKTINEVFLNFRNVLGTININIYIEDRSGNTISAKTFSITSTGSAGTSGIGTDLIGGIGMGLSVNDATIFAGELPKKVFIYKTSRIVQLEIRTTEASSNYELLGAKIFATPQSSRGDSNWIVS